MGSLRVGDRAPDFILSSSLGSPVRFDGLRGKVVVLYFYPADNTPGCVKEACRFRDHYDKFRALGVEVLGVSSDTEASHKAFAENLNLKYPLLSDRGSKIAKLYSARSFLNLIPKRITYVIDKQGIIRHIFSSQLRPEEHVKEALSKAEELQ